MVQWRTGDPVACAVHVGRIATGEIQESCEVPRGQNRQRTLDERGRRGSRCELDTGAEA